MVKLLCCHHKPLPRVAGRLCCHHKPLPRVLGRLCCHHKPLPRVAGRLCCHHKPLPRGLGRLCCHHKPSFPPTSGGGRSLFLAFDIFFIASPFCHDFIIFLHKTFHPRAKKASPLHFRRRRLCINRTGGPHRVPVPAHRVPVPV